MDVLAHTLWTNAGARGANALYKKYGKPRRLHVGWTAFWGVFPDFFAFTFTFIGVFYRLIFQGVPLSRAREGMLSPSGFDLAAYLYQYSHSLVIWVVVFFIVWIVCKRPRLELLGWALHILIDIPSHAIGFYATPFLFPISDYRFPYGVSWANTYFMIINYASLVIVWTGIAIKKLRKK